MFKWRIISRSNIHGKVHTFQKDFDDYDSYQAFISEHPEYSTKQFFEDFWNPWSFLESPSNRNSNSHSYYLPNRQKFLPDGIDLEKYEKRRMERRQLEAEKMEKKNSLERTQEYLQNYLKENPEDTEAKDDLKKIEKELADIHE